MSVIMSTIIMTDMLSCPMKKYGVMPVTDEKGKKPLGRILGERREHLRGSPQFFEQDAVGDALGFDQSYISRLEKGRLEKAMMKWKPERVWAMLKAYNLSDNEAQRLAEEYGLSVPTKGAPSFGIPGVAQAALAPFLGTISAGWKGLSAVDNGTETRAIPTWIVDRFGEDDIFALDVTGDSMTCQDVKVEIPAGSECFFHSELNPENGDIVAVWLDDHDMGVLKVYRPQDGYTVLESYNKQHPPIVVNQDNPGRVCGVYLGKNTRAPRFRNGNHN